MVELVNQLGKDYSQQNLNSRLYRDLFKVLGDREVATHVGKRACKVFCLWEELYVKAYIQEEFIDFFAYMKEINKVEVQTCKLADTQKNIITLFGLGSNDYMETYNIDILKNWRQGQFWLGTTRIKTGPDSFHSINTYRDDIVKISDISYRGQGTSFSKKINPNEFEYFTIIEKGVCAYEE